MFRLSIAVFFIFATILGVSIARVKIPWQRRVARNVEVRHKLSRQFVEVGMWPVEPQKPVSINEEKFKQAFSSLCGPMPEKRLMVFTQTLLGRSADFDVDPFLLAALVYDRSGCRPRTPDRETTHGVTRMNIEMHAPHIRRGQYRYFVMEGAQWSARPLDIGEYPFNKWKAEKIRSNLYFTAAIMRVFTEQCNDLDEALGSVPHRHPISHWFYGDRVRSSGPEDHVLTIRRRLLAYYNEQIPQMAGSFRGEQLVSPLDGVPRLVLDYFKNPRGKKGTYGHRGIDLDGVTGESVRAIADGRISFSGVDLPGAGSRQLTPEQGDELPSNSMGSGGLYIHINHGDGLGSIYMHLDSLAVSRGDEVEAGQIIGTLGRSGTVQSGPHLHLEIRVGTDRVDPAEVLSTVLVNPFLSGREKSTEDSKN